MDLSKKPKEQVAVPANVAVQDLGEDGDAWFVSGTKDLAVGQEAIRQHLRKSFSGRELHQEFVKFNSSYYTIGLDWYWVQLPNGDRCLLKVSLSGDRGLGDSLQLTTGIHFR